MENSKVSYEKDVEGVKLGKAPARSDVRMLNLNNYTTELAPPPVAYDFWSNRAPFPIKDYGNNEYGDCTIASQVVLSEYMERLEQRRTIDVPKQNIIDTYLAMTTRLYGGGDTGAYEIDALSNWRKPELSFKDTKGRPYTIDAYVKINQGDLNAVKNALVLSGAHGIKVCFNMPIAWARANNIWDIPVGQVPINEYLPGSWGGHSMTGIAKYDADWVYLPSTWEAPMGKITWRAFAIYCDEAYLVIDSVNAWKKRLDNTQTNTTLNIDGIVSDVNSVSSQKIK